MAKKPRKDAVAKRKAVDTPLVSAATVMYGEDATSRYSSYNALATETVSRALVGSAAAAAMMTATVCANQKLRLFRPKRGASAVWKSRPVSKDLRSYLAGEQRLRPAIKSMVMASQAGEIEEVVSHPVIDLLCDPDPQMTGVSFFKAMYWMHEMSGKAFAGVERGIGGPTALFWLPSQYVRVIPSRQSMIGGFRFGRNTAEAIDIGVDEMLYFRATPHPAMPWDGWTWVYQCARELDCEAAAIQAEMSRWLNGGMPGIVVEADPDASPAQLSQLKEGLARDTRGVFNAGNAMIIQRAKVVQYATKPHEMAYVEGQERLEAVVYRHAGIPETIWKLSDSNKASAAAGNPQYAELTIKTRIDYFAGYLTETLLPMYVGTDGWFFAYDNPVSEDEALQTTKATTAFAAGLVTRNEARQMMGLEAVPGPEGAEYHPAMNPPQPVAPVTNFVIPPQFRGNENADMAGRGGSGGNSGDDVSPSGEASGGQGSVQDLRGQSGTKRADDADRDEQSRADAGGVSQLDRGEQGLVGESRHRNAYKAAIPKCGWWYGHDHDHGTVTKDDRLGELPPELTRLVNGMASKIQQWIAGVAGDIHATPDGIINLNGQTEAFNSLVSQALADALAYGGKLQAESLGTAWDVTPDDALRILDNYRVRLANEVTGTLEADLNDALKATLADGLTVTDASRAIADALGEQAGYRSERIARSEVSHLCNRGADEAMKRAGIEQREWLLAGGPCPLCEAAIASRPTANVGEPFWRIGESIPGTDYVITYRDVYGGDLHPQCRCGVAPIIEEED